MNDASTLADVHGVAAYVGEIVVGNVSEVFTDADGRRLVGFVIRGQHGRSWFLPWVACSLGAGVLRASSPLVFIPSDQADFYVRYCIRVPASDLRLLSFDAHGCLRRSSEADGRGVLAVTGEGIPSP